MGRTGGEGGWGRWRIQRGRGWPMNDQFLWGDRSPRAHVENLALTSNEALPPSSNCSFSGFLTFFPSSGHSVNLVCVCVFFFPQDPDFSLLFSLSVLFTGDFIYYCDFNYPLIAHNSQTSVCSPDIFLHDLVYVWLQTEYLHLNAYGQWCASVNLCQLGPANKVPLCTSSPLLLAQWNHIYCSNLQSSRWTYLHHGNQQMFQIRAPLSQRAYC